MPRPLERNPKWPSQGDPNHAQVHPSSKDQGSEEQTAGSGRVEMANGNTLIFLH